MESLSFSKFVAKKRVLLGKSQKQLAEALSYTPQAVSRFESLNSAFPIELLNSLCRFLECSVEDIHNRNLEPSIYKKVRINWDDLPKTLARTRKTVPLTQEEFAEALGISSRVIRNYESGATTPSYQLLEKWADLAKISPTALLEEVAPKTEKPINAPVPFYRRPLVMALIAIALIAVPAASISIPLAIRNRSNGSSQNVPTTSESSGASESDSDFSGPVIDSGYGVSEWVETSEPITSEPSVYEEPPTDEEYTPGIEIEEGVVMGYSGISEELIIPGHWKGYTVTSIKPRAFYGCPTLQTITVPDTFTEIPAQAFADANTLQKINLPDTIKSIGDYAITCGWAFRDFELPPNLESLGENVFVGTGINTLHFPASLVSVKNTSFYEMRYLKEITVDEDNPAYSSFGGVLYNKDKTQMIFCPINIHGVLTLPKELKTFDVDLFFAAWYLTEIQVEEGSEYFSSYDGLLYNAAQTKLIYIPEQVKASITLPATLTSVNFDLFVSSTNLKEVNVDENNPTFASSDGVVYSKDLTRMRYFPIYYEKTVVIPQPTRTLDLDNIQQATKLLGFIVTEGNAYFSMIDGVLFNKAGSELLAYPHTKTDTAYNVPESTEIIHDGAFQYHEHLKEVTFPDHLYAIGDHAFQYVGLTYIEFGSGLQTIGDDAFSGAQVTDLELPDGLTSIGSCAFSDCRSLVTLTLPDTITEILNDAFHNCESLLEVTLPPKLTRINLDCFANCAFTSINIPQGVTSIGWGAFYSNTRLEEVILPSSLTEITENAFGECNKIAYTYYRGTKTQFGKITIRNGQGTLLKNVYYYLAVQPTVSGNYWHYVDGVPTIW